MGFLRGVRCEGVIGLAVLTQENMEDLIWRATVLALGLDPDSDDESIHKRVRISWPESEGTTWGRSENVIFFRITLTPDDFTPLKDITHVYDSEHDTLTEKVEYHRRFNVNWLCYGPDAMNEADTIRIGILREPIKTMLKEHGIAFLPHIRDAIRLDEVDQSGDWWRRNDLSADFYVLSSREYSEDYIALPPQITISKNN